MYVSEAHPVDEWQVYNAKDVDFCQPVSLADRIDKARRLQADIERRLRASSAAAATAANASDAAPPAAPTASAVAAAAALDLLPPPPELEHTLVVDGMGNTAEQLYAAHPERLFVIDFGSGGKTKLSDATVVYKSDVGPFGYKPDELAAFLETLQLPTAGQVTAPGPPMWISLAMAALLAAVVLRRTSSGP